MNIVNVNELKFSKNKLEKDCNGYYKKLKSRVDFYVNDILYFTLVKSEVCYTKRINGKVVNKKATEADTKLLDLTCEFENRRIASNIWKQLNEIYLNSEEFKTMKWIS